MDYVSHKARTIGLFMVAAALLAQVGCANNNPPTPQANLACPSWVNYPADWHSNAESPYLGCANRVNLENMVANPQDLKEGRPLGPASGEREAAGVRAYEQGRIKAFSNPNAPTPLVFTPGITMGASQ